MTEPSEEVTPEGALVERPTPSEMTRTAQIALAGLAEMNQMEGKPETPTYTLGIDPGVPEGDHSAENLAALSAFLESKGVPPLEPINAYAQYLLDEKQKEIDQLRALLIPAQEAVRQYRAQLGSLGALN